MEAKKEDIKIYGKLVNVTTENVVADAQQIWDSNFEENQQNINKSIRNDFNSFKKNPQFENATFTGNSTFGGDVKVNENFSVDGESNFNGVIKAHGLPNSIIADHKITTNDLEVMGTFTALNLDVNNLTVHNLLKVENGGSLRIDGDTILNNVIINGDARLPHATTQKYGIVRLAENADDPDSEDVVTVSMLEDYASVVLPDATEGQVLIYTNGKWQGGDIDTIINNNENVSNYIKNLIQQNISQSVDLSNYYTKSEIDSKLNDLRENIGGDISTSCLWEVNSNGRLTPKNGKDVEAAHFYKNA